MTEDQSGLEGGRRRVLHSGPLRGLRAFGWMVALFVIFTIVYAGAQVIESPVSHQAGGVVAVLGVAAVCLAGLGLYAGAGPSAEAPAAA